MWEQSVLWEGYSRRSNLYRHARAHIHACLRHILVLIPDVIGTDGILAGSRVGDFSRRGHPPSGRCTTSPVQQQLMRRPRHLAGLRLSGGFGLPRRSSGAFPSSSNPSWLALSDGRGLCALDAVVFWLRSAIAISSWYGQAISSSFAASRFTALIVVERRLVVLLFLMVGVFRLPTPLLWQWLMPHPVTWRGCDCLAALATSMRLRRFFHRRAFLRG